MHRPDVPQRLRPATAVSGRDRGVRPSPAGAADRLDRAVGQKTDAFNTALRRFALTQGVPWVDFAKGERKDDVMHRHLARFETAGRTDGVLFIGRPDHVETTGRPGCMPVSSRTGGR